MPYPRILGCLLVFCISAFPAVYEVGPGKPLGSIGAVPWATLQAGDTVRIHYRTQPYQEKWAICRQGTASSPITVTGVPGPGGALPVIDGNNAVTAPGLNFWNDERGVLKIGGCNTPADVMPRHIIIENLEIRNALTSQSFTDESRIRKNYIRNAAVMYIEKCESCTIRNNVLHDSGNVIFISSPVANPSRNIVLQGNRIYGGGNSGSGYEHNIYAAAIGITIEGNYFGPLRTGASGNNVKDRSAGTVIRYNWIEGGNRQLDLVDGEDTAYIQNDPAYHVTYVYGNVLIERAGDGNQQMVHYGGDSSNTGIYRKGTLHFYNNTLVSYRTDRNTFFRLSTNSETADVRNNIFYTTLAGTGNALLDSNGILKVSRNWIKAGWRGSFSVSNPQIQDDGSWENGSSPSFVNEAGQDFHLAAASGAVNAGGNLNAAVLPQHALMNQYVKHQSTEPRPSDGLFDIGAFELNGAPAPSVNQPPVAVLSLSATSGNSPLTVSFSSAGSHDPDGTIASYRWTFGNGGTASGPSATHTYTTAGTFTVTLEVTDNKGTKASTSRSFTVTQPVLQKPGIPVVTATVSGNRAMLSWPLPGGGTPTGYSLFQRGSNGQWVWYANMTTRSYTRILGRGTWGFRVRAYNAAGASDSQPVDVIIR
jgi:PKD repeat protein